MLREKAKTTYHFPYAFDNDGYPKVSRVVPTNDYRKYEKAVKRLYERLQLSKITINSQSESLVLKIDEERFNPITLNSDKCKALSYPAKYYKDRTIATSGKFIVMANMVIDYFNKSDSENLLKDLLRIALWGDWHHPNGTWPHYLDVICEAYGIETTRLSSINHILEWMKKGGVSVALLDDIAGNCLVFIIEVNIAGNYIEYYLPEDNEKARRIMKIEEFILHTKVLWGMEVK